MSENIKNINLVDNTVISTRNITSDTSIISLDFNQVTGEYLATRPLNVYNEADGEVIIYPSSTQLTVNTPVTIKNFTQTISLYYPLDARFDYTNGKIWIVDTGNKRILKVKKNTPTNVDVIVRNLIYPHALAVNFNNGGAFVKAFTNYGMTHGIVYSLKSNGVENYNFVYEINEEDSSTSSSSNSSSSLSTVFLSESSSSSSGPEIFPTLPAYNTLVYDHVRGRVWWVSGNTIYMADENNMQVETFDLISEGYYSLTSIDVELNTGNAFVIAKDIHNETYLLKIYRDNNLLMGFAYIAE